MMEEEEDSQAVHLSVMPESGTGNSPLNPEKNPSLGECEDIAE
jgi:hypothetical protein